MSTLNKIPNLGPVMMAKLKTIGVISQEELSRRGYENVFIQLQTVYPDLCICSFYALAGAVAQKRWHSFSPEEREVLKLQYDRITGKKCKK